jgi:[ribosomal protein S5]-alanine N-acetyltransferase
MMLAMSERLDSKRFYLERLRYEFAEEIFYAYASKPEATTYVSWPTHQSADDTRAYLRYAVAAWKRGIDYAYVIRLHGSNRLVGAIGCLNDQGKVQFGYIISPHCWNQGYATEATQTLLVALRLLPNVYKIWTFIDADNQASARVLLKCGLVEEARLSKWFRFVNQGNVPKDCVLFKVPEARMAI